MFLLLAALLQSPAFPPNTLVVGCSVTGDAEHRTYELRRLVADGAPSWVLVMHSPAAGKSPILLPLPDAKPTIANGNLTLSYSTLNGGRAVEWRVAPAAASLDVHANFELEVNVEADLDPRVELMNTNGVLTNLTCAVAPQL